MEPKDKKAVKQALKNTDSEFVLKARYKLVSKEQPNLLSTSIFDSFESLDNLVVTVISNEQQQQYILTDVQSQIQL